MSGFTPGPWSVETPMGKSSPWIVEAGKQAFEWDAIATLNARRLSKRLPMSTDLDEPFDAYRWPAYPDDFPGLREMQIANGCDDIVCEFADGFCPCREQFAASRGERRDTRGWFARLLAWWRS